MADVTFQVLGPLAVRVDGSPVPLRSNKQRTVLAALLVAQQHRVSVGRLVDAVWDDALPSTADKQVRNAVSVLRAALVPTGATITAIPGGYHLDIGDADLDLHRFQQHLARAQAHLREEQPDAAVGAFREALSAWSGAMLVDVRSQVLQALATRTQEARLSAAEDCLDLELAAGRHRDLLDELAKWVDRNPLREHMVAQYMLALHRCGARARAFEVYEDARHRLAEQLGLGPGPEITAVHRTMLQDDATSGAATSAGRRPAPAGGVGLLPSAVELVGRESEVATLVADAAVPRPQRLLVVDGMPGVGTTALVVRVAHDLASGYPDGQLFLDLRGYDHRLPPSEPAEALRALLVLSGDREPGTTADVEELTQAWRRRTAAARMLVVLDDVADADHLHRLLPAGAGCLTLLTSRRRLALTEPCPTRVLSLDPLPRARSRDLLHRLLGDRRDGADRAALDAIAHHCGDLPLALSAAAARLRRRPSWPLHHLAERLADPALRLTELQTEHGGMLAAYDASVRHLNPALRSLLGLLGGAPQSPLDVAAVAVLAQLTAPAAEQALQDLVDEHLLLHPRPGLYELHPLVRLYCARLSARASAHPLVAA